MEKMKLYLKDIIEIAIFISIAIVLDKLLKIPFAPTGGSINLSMVPLLVIALRHGPFKAFIAGGIVFGLITNLLDGYGLNTYPMEYLIAFGATGILGLFAKTISKSFENKKDIFLSYIILILSVALIATIRVLAASVDSVLFYELDWGAAILYNVSYVYLSALFSLIATAILLPIIGVLNKSFKTAFLNKKRA